MQCVYYWIVKLCIILIEDFVWPLAFLPPINDTPSAPPPLTVAQYCLNDEFTLQVECTCAPE